MSESSQRKVSLPKRVSEQTCKYGFFDYVHLNSLDVLGSHTLSFHSFPLLL